MEDSTSIEIKILKASLNARRDQSDKDIIFLKGLSQIYGPEISEVLEKLCEALKDFNTACFEEDLVNITDKIFKEYAGTTEGLI